jgi:hypothetical protein
MLLLKSVKPIRVHRAVQPLYSTCFLCAAIPAFFLVDLPSHQGKPAVCPVHCPCVLVFLILGTSLLTFTTSPIALTDALERS